MTAPRLLTASLTAAALLAGIALPASASVTGGCDGLAVIDGAAYTPANDTRANPVVIPAEGGVVDPWRGSTPFDNNGHEGKLRLHLGPAAIEVAGWGDDDPSAPNSSSAEGTYALDDFRESLPFPIRGLYRVSGTHAADGGSCDGFVLLKFDGSLFASPVAQGAAGLGLLTIVLLVLAGMATSRAADAGVVRGRRWLGAIAGLLLGLSVAVLLQQASVWPLDTLSSIGLPLLALIGGLVVGHVAPLGRGRFVAVTSSGTSLPGSGPANAADGRPDAPSGRPAEGPGRDTGVLDEPVAGERTPTRGGTEAPAPTASGPVEGPREGGAVPEGVPAGVPGDPTAGSVPAVVAIEGLGKTRPRRPSRPEDPGPTTPVPVSTSVPDVSARCDWAMYVEEAGGPRRVRAARGRECCVYTLRLTTAVDVLDGEAKGRTEPDLVGGDSDVPAGRLRLTDYDAVAGDLAVDVFAGVRSGPLGRLDWLQADMPEPTRTLPDSDHVQLAPFEDPADVALNFRYTETHRLTVTLTSGCPSHSNRYGLEGRTELTLGTAHECTNSKPGDECPVELAAVVAADAEGAKDLSYTLDELIPGDTDDLEGRLRLGEGGGKWRGLLDAHDHVTRSRDEYTGRVSGGDLRVKEGDALAIELLHRADVQAGAIVPAHVWDHTDRVSVRGQVTFDSYLGVEAKMDSHCGSMFATSCEHSETCACAPAFKLDVDRTGAHLTVDGRRHLMRRPDGLAFAFVPSGRPLEWELK